MMARRPLTNLLEFPEHSPISDGPSSLDACPRFRTAPVMVERRFPTRFDRSTADASPAAGAYQQRNELACFSGLHAFALQAPADSLLRCRTASRAPRVF